MANKYFPFYESFTNAMDVMTDEEAGQLIKALGHHAYYGEDPEDLDELPPIVTALYVSWTPLVDNAMTQSDRNSNNRKRSSRTKKTADKKTDNSRSESAQRPSLETETTVTENVNDRSENEQTTLSIEKEKEKEREKETEKREKGPVRASPFRPPSSEEVRAYARERGEPSFDGEAFCNFYASKGWCVGRSPMRDWKAAVRNWIGRDRKQATSTASMTDAQRRVHDKYAHLGSGEEYHGAD